MGLSLFEGFGVFLFCDFSRVLSDVVLSSFISAFYSFDMFEVNHGGWVGTHFRIRLVYFVYCLDL
ncbi:hypothetical protein HanRHA438_Chr11g0484891 [Helianthus annuus]|nr:hypothetical protein HanRHA438_Chr11g0484891 [Helianthus annuus]